MLDASLSLLVSDFPDGESPSLSVDHDGESLEVTQVGAGFSLGHLLGNGKSIETLLDIGGTPSLNDVASAGSSVEVGDDLGESQSSQRVDHSGEVGSINEDPVLVGNIYDHDNLAIILSKVNECDSAGFDESSIDLKGQT